MPPPSAPGQSSPELNAKRPTLCSRACQVQGPSSYSRARGERVKRLSSDRDRGAEGRSTTQAGSRNAARNLSARAASREVPTHRSRSSNNRRRRDPERDRLSVPGLMRGPAEPEPDRQANRMRKPAVNRAARARSRRRGIALEHGEWESLIAPIRPQPSFLQVTITSPPADSGDLSVMDRRPPRSCTRSRQAGPSGNWSSSS